jgi:hypothetical protein
VTASAPASAAPRIHELSLEDSMVRDPLVRIETPNAYARSEENRQTEMCF